MSLHGEGRGCRCLDGECTDVLKIAGFQCCIHNSHVTCAGSNDGGLEGRCMCCRLDVYERRLCLRFED